MAVNNRDIVDTNKRFVSPKGILEPYAYLNRPDYGQDHFKNERGKYKATVTYDLKEPAVQKLVAWIDELFEETYATYLKDHKENPPPPVPRGKKPLEPYQGNLPYTENDDGTVTFRFEAWAAYTDRKTNAIRPINMAYADARGKPIKQTALPNIFAGTELRVSFKVLPYGWSTVAGAAIKLQLQGAMLINVVESSQEQDNGFGEYAEEDGGFDAAEHTAHKDASQGVSAAAGEAVEESPWEGEDELGTETPQGTGDF